MPVHIKWGGGKTESWTPAGHSQYETVALYIWGDHCFCVGDPATTRAIAKEKVSAPTARPHEVLATIGRRANTTPASQYWESYTKLAPGHFQAPNFLAVRVALLEEGICPQVKLSGTGQMKGLRYKDCHVHASRRQNLYSACCCSLPRRLGQQEGRRTPATTTTQSQLRSHQPPVTGRTLACLSAPGWHHAPTRRSLNGQCRQPGRRSAW